MIMQKHTRTGSYDAGSPWQPHKPAHVHHGNRAGEGTWQTERWCWGRPLGVWSDTCYHADEKVTYRRAFNGDKCYLLDATRKIFTYTNI